MRNYLEKGAAYILSGRVRLTESTRIPEGEQISSSDGLLSTTATRLSLSFGADAAEQMYPMDTWAGSVGYSIGVMVDYFALADRLLREYVPEYVPSEAHHPGLQTTGEDEHEGKED
jgi:hypothetical protein